MEFIWIRDPDGGADARRRTAILAPYASGLTGREIQAFLAEMYPVVFFDALRVKIRDEGT